jgi:membrane-associated phospholipid phosphatase
MKSIVHILRLCAFMLPVLSSPLCFGGEGSRTDSTGAARRPAFSIIEGDGIAFLRMAGHVFSAPARWDGGAWGLAGGLVAGTAGASFLDNDARTMMQRNHTRANDRVSDVAVQYGSGLTMLLVSAGGYTAGLAFGEDWIRETSLLSGTAIILAGTISTVSKIAVGRARPYKGEGRFRFRPFSFNDGYVSFPSGHTIVAFAVSGVLAERIKNPWASVGLYGLAAATGLSRMYTDDHWLSDVLFGAVISISVSRSLVQWYERKSTGGDENGLQIVPSGNGIALVWRF